MSGRSKGLMAMWGEPIVKLGGADAEKLGIGGGDLVRISSANGSVEMRARIVEENLPGQVFLPIHHPDQSVNRLLAFPTNGAGRHPSIKSLAVKLGRIGRPAP